MANRLFSRSSGISLNGYVVSPTPPASTTFRTLVDSGFSTGSNGISIVLAAGGSASTLAANARFATAIPNYTGAAVGSWKITQGFQSVVPTSVYSKVRVHRATVSGTVLTIATTGEWSDETLTNKTVQRWEHYLDQVDLGTWAATNALIVEYAYRNAGTASITIQPTGANAYQNAIYTPFNTSAAFGYTNQLPVGQRLYIYSQGGIRGTSRYLKQTTSVIASTGTATGTKGGSDFSGTVTGVSSSTGTATGRAGFTGSVVGASTSSGTIAAGLQGYAGSAIGSSVSSGTAVGSVGFTGSVSGESISTGTATGTPDGPPSPERRPGESPFRRRVPYPVKLTHHSGRITPVRIVSFGLVFGSAIYQGSAMSTVASVGYAAGMLGYGGRAEFNSLHTVGALSKATVKTRATSDFYDLVLMGEI